MFNLQKIQKNKRGQLGFSTLEILLAMTILIFTLSAVLSSLSGGQSLGVDSQTNSEALRFAQASLESTQALARKDFLSINSATTSYSGNFYSNDQSVVDISPCSKKITNDTKWDKNSGSQSSKLSTIVTSSEEALKIGGNCNAAFVPPGDWQCPSNPDDITGIGGNGSDIEAMNKLIYLAVTKVNMPIADADFYVAWPPYDKHPPAPVDDFIGIDLGGEGANSVAVAYYPNIDRYYAFVAVDYKTIVASGAHAGEFNLADAYQLQIIDVTDYKHINEDLNSDGLPDSIVKRISLGVTGDCTNNLNSYCPGGRTVYFYNNRLYIGTHRTGGDEFQIYNVSTPDNPSSINLIGKREINHNINKIVVRGNYAFLATSADAEELQVYNISNPDINDVDYNNIDFVNAFNAKRFNGGGSESDGISLSVLGDYAYLGRDSSAGSAHPNFHVIDISSPQASLPLIGQMYIPGNGNASVFDHMTAGVNDIIITSGLAFLAIDEDSNTVGNFQIWDVSNPGEWDVDGPGAPDTDHVCPNKFKCGEINCGNCSDLKLYGNKLALHVTALAMEDGTIYSAWRDNAIVKILQSNAGTVCPGP